jgi:Cu-Zn family superoxide dismutase
VPARFAHIWDNLTMKIRALALTAPLVLLTGCPGAIETEVPSALVTNASAWTVHGPASPSPAPATEFPPGTVASGTFLPYRPGSPAITYDPAVVPPGATAELTITDLPYGTEVRLRAEGLIPSRAYGAHLHTRPCTGVPDEAGPHYQHHQDPKPPSVNPVYANPKNEVWLDFTADGKGVGAALSVHGWDFAPSTPPRSLILHAEHTRTEPGEAGKAGSRAACLTLPGA